MNYMLWNKKFHILYLFLPQEKGSFPSTYFSLFSSWAFTVNFTKLWLDSYKVWQPNGTNQQDKTTRAFSKCAVVESCLITWQMRRNSVCVCCMCAETSQTVDKYWQVIGFFLKNVLNPLLSSPLLSWVGHLSLPQLQWVQKTSGQGSHPGSLHYLWPVVKHILSFLQPTYSLSHLSWANYQHYHLIFRREAKRNDRVEVDEKKRG